MKRLVGTFVLCSLVLAVAACGDDADSKATVTTVAAGQSEGGSDGAATNGDTNGDTTDAPDAPEGGDVSEDEFCGLLVQQVQEMTDFAGTIGTPEQDAALDKMTASNELITSSAPDELQGAMEQISQVSALARDVLIEDDQAAAAAASAEAATAPEVLQAYDEYRAWVNDNCDADATVILSAGG